MDKESMPSRDEVRERIVKEVIREAIRPMAKQIAHEVLSQPVVIQVMRRWEAEKLWGAPRIG
ncbi:MAG: hypothetical protein JWQ10_1460 [Herbaspirillum sp.]|nr:hypothetical protein [Herbaspirillum sp.]